MKNCLKVLAALLGLLVLPSSLCAAPLLSLDLNSGASPTQSGFTGWNGFNAKQGPTILTNAGGSGIDFSITTSSADNSRDRGTLASTDSDFYRDFASNVSSFTLSNLTALTTYEIRVWAYDSSVSSGTATFAVTTGTGTGGSINWTNAPVPTSLSAYSLLMTVTSDASGVITFSETGATRLNGIEVTAVPEPATCLLVAGSLFALVFCRRRRA